VTQPTICLGKLSLTAISMGKHIQDLQEQKYKRMRKDNGILSVREAKWY
jgi:hypothetical protein